MTTMEATQDVTAVAPVRPGHVPHDKLVIMAWSGDLDQGGVRGDFRAVHM